jgi:hypothetical protein
VNLVYRASLLTAAANYSAWGGLVGTRVGGQPGRDVCRECLMGIVASASPAYTRTMEPLYDIYFSGQLVEEFEAAEVRDNLVKLFKVNTVALEKLFSGKPQPIKRGVDKAGAIKYKTAMARAGAVAVIKAHSKASVKPAASAATPSATSDTPPHVLT